MHWSAYKQIAIGHLWCISGTCHYTASFLRKDKQDPDKVLMYKTSVLLSLMRGAVKYLELKMTTGTIGISLPIATDSSALDDLDSPNHSPIFYLWKNFSTI